MSPEHASNTGDFISASALSTEEESVETFVWQFNLSEIDPSLIFDESEVPQKSNTKKPAEKIKSSEAQPTFSQWLQHTVPAEEEPSKQIPHAFTWAQKESVKASERLANVSLIGLNTIGGALGSLMSIVGACGPLCFHTLRAVANAGSGFSMSTPGLGGVSMPGFNVDGNGNFTLSGNIDSLTKATGLSKDELIAGTYSVQEILTTFLSIFGEGMYQICGFGLIECLINSLIPLPQETA